MHTTEYIDKTHFKTQLSNWHKEKKKKNDSMKNWRIIF